MLVVLSIGLPSCQEEELPALSTSPVTNITTNTACCGGNITSDGRGHITEKGVCWNTTGNPTTNDNKTSDGQGVGSYISNLTGLLPCTNYYLKAFAINEVGTAYGNEIIFTTTSNNSSTNYNPNLTYGTVSDIEGNVYKTIQIGTQIWMAENMRATRRQDGTPINLVTDNTMWGAWDQDPGYTTSPKYCWFNNDEATYRCLYGALYNFPAAEVCPTGWHVPSYGEWNTLINYLGGKNLAGGRMKEIGFIHWNNPNSGATNESGFTALPGGGRASNGIFSNTGSGGSWWTSNSDGLYEACAVFLSYETNYIHVDWMYYKTNGRSVRCLKD